MTWEPRPVPELTPETAPFWEAAAAGRLLLSHCTACDLVFHYPRAFCPDCFSDAVEWQEATGTGILYSYSTMTRVSGWPDSALPLVVAYVELDEGPRIMTNIVDCDPDDLSVGDPVHVRFEPTEDDAIGIPVFTPTDP